jgi:hypothetical protein
MKIYFRSGNYIVEKSAGKLRIGELAPSKKCKCPKCKTRFVGMEFADGFDGLSEAMDACICMASDSLKAGSGAKIVKLG